ncbi:Nramp family divalent metal transporter [Halarsenatibacter silvermanii]|uniref:Manganese transport protein n=1 Tax=Halarsenatibacter silvermanii TaxID=321763 RepID=A0A1G9PWT5_9FIRM|nr:Nramp family divalent metal transporter [Halarsenatibacter silvermanii]SDM03220.1 manganese transport protein [Halarsenatibacter silvermanii]
MNLIERLKQIGPGAMVAAAFIGPGTVTTATVTGADHGFVLLWAVAFSILSVIVLQEFSARLGIVSGEGLGEALRKEFSNPIIKFIAVFLVVGAIGVGAAAFETGNILGGAMGLATITGVSEQIWGPVIGLIALAILWTGKYELVEKVLIGLVALMSVSFVATALILRPDMGEIMAGLFAPSLPEGEGLTLVIALIGTTVVPYNLFLHASSVQDKWQGTENLNAARFDTIFSIIVGGIITLAIVITSAAVIHGTGMEVADAGDMAVQLEPTLGRWAKWFFAIGLFGAGFSSAATAPLAGAYATAGALGWKRDLKSTKFRAVLLIILLIGVIGSAMGADPVQLIIFAQAVNGILLPISAVFLLYVMNNTEKLGEYTNGTFANIIGGIIVAITIIIGIMELMAVFGG